METNATSQGVIFKPVKWHPIFKSAHWGFIICGTISEVHCRGSFDITLVVKRCLLAGCISTVNCRLSCTGPVRVCHQACYIIELVDWCSGLTTRLGLRLGRGATGLIPRSAFVFCGGENVCVHSLCMGVGVRTTLLAFIQLSSVTEGFIRTLCWRTGQTWNHPFSVNSTWLEHHLYSTSLVF